MVRTPLRPVRWTPPADPGFDRGPFARNEALADVEVLPVPGEGPEDASFDAEGNVYVGVEDGRILVLPGGDAANGWRTVGNTGGRPGGIEVDGTSLVIADYLVGVVRMDIASGRVEVLVREVDGRPLRCTNNCALGPDGRIWFSTSSERWDVHDLRLDAVEHTATGRLLVHDPSDGSTRVVLDDLPMANGVAIAQDGSFVAVANTAGYDVDRHWLTGPRAGTTDKLVASLPGMPDNLSVGADGRIWIAMVVPRNPILERLLPLHPALRVALGLVPEAIVPDGPRCMLAVAVDPGSGEVVANLQSWGGSYHYVTGVNEHRAADGHTTLWFTSIKEHAVARIHLA